MARFFRTTDHDKNRDGSVEFESLEFPPRLKSSLCLDSPGEKRRMNNEPLKEDQFNSYFDPDGRLINEHHLRRAVCRGGIDAGIRREVWQFIFELFPFHSTKRERDMMLIDYHMKYFELKRCWNEQLNQETFPDPDDIEILEPSYLAGIPSTSGDELPKRLQATPDNQQLQYLAIQAKVFGGRLNLNIKEMLPYIRIIDKDVPRTDRDLEYFAGATNRHLRVLRDILLTYAAFNQKLGYTQGMNDIAARFMIVFDDEVEAFWCFSNYMKLIQDNFVEHGLLNKLRHVRLLLSEVDPDLLNYLEFLEIADLTFCHRWMLLNFKRELNLVDGLRCFEILSSHHLEISSLEAQRAREKQKRKDFQHQGGTNQIEEPVLNFDFTFDVFMCATILIMRRDALFTCRDGSDVFQLICGPNSKMDLDVILGKAEVLFYKYCSKSVTDCFQLIG